MKTRVRYIYLAFAISFLITVVISILYLEEFSALQKNNEQLEKSYQVKNKILRIQGELIEAENTQRGYVITEDKQLLKALDGIRKNNLDEIDQLRELTIDIPEQQQIILRLKETVLLRYQILYKTADAENSSDLAVFLHNAEEGKRVMKNFMLLSNKMDEIESKLFAKRKKDNNWLGVVTSFYLKLILIFSILFQSVSLFIITRAFKRRKIYQKILENKIKELNLSNSEMEQIAFVASHDLQEPLRKIRTFGDKLIKHNSSSLNKDGQKWLEKMALSAKHMQELLHDFVNYTRIVKSSEEARVIKLQKVIDDVQAELKDTIENKKAVIIVDSLPEITGFNYQLHLLFSNLIENALKFSEPSRPPVIKITSIDDYNDDSTEERKYIRVSVSDNGIGFEEEFAEKIFVIFQRLHSQNSSYLGKGIGLAICKKIMINHDGFISATGKAGMGATFHLFFPQTADLETIT